MTTHPVIDLIKKRYYEGSKPQARGDSYKLGLVLEGGSMRGVVSAGMAAGLHYLDLVKVFDAVYGASAGALAGSLFITNSMPIGPTIYYEDLNNSKFINLTRFFSKKKPIMDLDYLLINILSEHKLLDWKAVLKSDIPLKIIASSIIKRKSVCFDNYKTKEELFTLLKASASVPIIAGKPINYNGDLLVDSSVYESIPYKTALNDDCTHILVLLTRPEGELRGKPSTFERLFVAKQLDKLNPGLGEDYLERAQRYKKNIDFLSSAKKDNKVLPSIYSIQLSNKNEAVPRLEKSKEILKEATIAGMRATIQLFINNGFEFHELLIPTNKYCQELSLQNEKNKE